VTGNTARSKSLPIVIGAAVAAMVVGCSSNPSPSASSAAPATTTAASPATTTADAPATTTAAASGPGQIIVPLGNEPSGTVVLTWDPQTKFVTAKIAMVGLTPGSTHAMHIHQGSCDKQGDVLVPFLDVTADNTGQINDSVLSAQPSAAGLAAGTLLNIHLAPANEMGEPGSQSYQPISCADIDPAAGATLQMAPLPQFGDHPQSQAILNYDPTAKTLTVSVHATGLVAGSAHAVHIHSGSCNSQGDVKYHLNDLVAKPDGVAETPKAIQNVDQAPPASGWYVNVHLGGHDQIEKDGKPTLYFAPILCGNVTG
jgi:Cu/Zn superoxide dismutase